MPVLVFTMSREGGKETIASLEQLIVHRQRFDGPFAMRVGEEMHFMAEDDEDTADLGVAHDHSVLSLIDARDYVKPDDISVVMYADTLGGLVDDPNDFPRVPQHLVDHIHTQSRAIGIPVYAVASCDGLTFESPGEDQHVRLLAAHALQVVNFEIFDIKLLEQAYRAVTLGFGALGPNARTQQRSRSPRRRPGRFQSG